MSNKMITAAWDVPLSAHARLVLIALADASSDDEGVCWISNKTMMEKSTCAKTTLGYILFAFEKLGIILRETRFRPENGSQTSSLKRIVIPVFNGTKTEITEKKAKFASEYEIAYLSARSKKYPPSHHVTGGEGSQCDLPHTTLGDLPQVTLGDPLYEPSYEPSVEFEEDDEVSVAEQINNVPPQFVHLPIPVLQEAIDRAVAKLAKRSPSGYRRRLLEGLSEGDEGWISTVLEFVKQVKTATEAPWERDKRLKRDKGESIVVALQEAGYKNIFDFLENRGTA